MVIHWEWQYPDLWRRPWTGGLTITVLIQWDSHTISFLSPYRKTYSCAVFSHRMLLLLIWLMEPSFLQLTLSLKAISKYFWILYMSWTPLYVNLIMINGLTDKSILQTMEDIDIGAELSDTESLVLHNSAEMEWKEGSVESRSKSENAQDTMLSAWNKCSPGFTGFLNWIGMFQLFVGCARVPTFSVLWAVEL